jgi:hypothetical protein
MAGKEVESRRPYETALLEIKGRAELDSEGNSFDIAAKVADKIMEAGSIEAIIAAAEQGPEDLSDLVGVAFNFMGSLSYLKSADRFSEGGTGYYVVFQCRDTKGNDHTVSTGAVNVMFQLRAFEKQGMFDNPDVLSSDVFTIKSRPTGRGELYWITFA